MDATMFSALGEPSRLQIVELLRQRPRAVGDIADELGMRQPQASKHLRVLREAGLVDVTPVARQRIHHLRRQRFDELDGWLKAFETQWDRRLDALGELLAATTEPYDLAPQSGESPST